MQDVSDKIQYSAIVIGIILNQQDEILVTERTAGKHLQGYWEFPGGKVSAGESLEAALLRELKEEVDIEVIDYAALSTHYHSYADDCHLALHFFLVTEWHGTVVACEDQPLHWCKRNQLHSEQFPPANQAIIATLLAW